MKKNYFMLAAATMMLAACAETELVNEVNVESTPQAIGFETFANKATRVTENSSGGYTNGTMNAHHDNFAVWAYKNTSDVLVFDNTEVTSSDYAYSPTRYWDKTATIYEFYAAAPKTTTPAWEFVGNTTNKDKAYFKLTNATLEATNFIITPSTDHITTFKGLSGDVDWMIADKCPVEKVHFAETYKVQLNFIHILSRLNIIVKKSATAPTITLNSVTVKGLNLKGSFNEDAVEADGTGKTGRWELANPAVTTSDYKYAADYTLTSNNDYVLQSLVIPQEVEYQPVNTDGSNLGATPKAYLEIVYTINSEIFKAYYNLAAVFGSSSANVPFNEGYQNTLTITIAPEAINFASNVALWADGTEKEEPID